MVDRTAARAMGLGFEHAVSNLFFYAIFTLLGKAIRLDRRSTADAEQQFMYALRTFGLQGASQSFAMRAFADGAAAPQSAEACAVCVRAHIPDDPALLLAIFDAFCDILFACGDLNESEHESVWTVGRALELDEDVILRGVSSRRHQRGYTKTDPDTVIIRRRRAALPVAVQEAYKQLGADPLADLAQVRKRYRALMREYHPDVTETQSFTAGYRDFANRRLHEIGEAVTCIKKYFNKN